MVQKLLSTTATVTSNELMDVNNMILNILSKTFRYYQFFKMFMYRVVQPSSNTLIIFLYEIQIKSKILELCRFHIG